jgi:hypothetical protein
MRDHVVELAEDVMRELVVMRENRKRVDKFLCQYQV